MAKDDPSRGLSGVALEQHNLGIAYVNQGKFGQAEDADQKSVALYRQLAAKDEPTYGISAAGTLLNLGEAYRRDGQLSLAINSYQEALEIYRRLAVSNPVGRGRDAATTLNALGVLYGQSQKFTQAVDCYEQSLDAYHSLSKTGHGDYPREEAWVLNNLAGLAVEHHLPLKKAKIYIQQAVRIQRDLWNRDPSLYGDELAASLIVEAQLLGIPGSHGGKACALISEALRISFSDVIKQGARTLSSRCN
jgi:tetratricopeptide (TPR) repeat protein